MQQLNHAVIRKDGSCTYVPAEDLPFSRLVHPPAHHTSCCTPCTTVMETVNDEIRERRGTLIQKETAQRIG